MAISKRALAELRSTRYGSVVELRGEVDFGRPHNLLEGPSPETVEELETYKLGNETWIFTWECERDRNALPSDYSNVTAHVTMGSGGTQLRDMVFDLFPQGSIQLPSTFSRIDIQYEDYFSGGASTMAPMRIRGMLRRGNTSKKAKKLIYSVASAALTPPPNITIPAYADDFIVGHAGGIPGLTADSDATYNAGTSYYQLQPGGFGVPVHRIDGPSMLAAKNSGFFIPVAAAARDIFVDVTAGANPFVALYTFRIGM